MAELEQLRATPDLTKRRQVLSPLMQAKAAATNGEKVNVCPYGCELPDLDDHGYCRHLVGFTNDGKLMEPMIVNDRGKRVVQPKMVQKDPSLPPPNLEKGEEREKVPVLDPVLKTDKLIRITCSHRVYREHPEPKEEPVVVETKSKKSA